MTRLQNIVLCLDKKYRFKYECILIGKILLRILNQRNDLILPSFTDYKLLKMYSLEPIAKLSANSQKRFHRRHWRLIFWVMTLNLWG
jgi:hypothetical protein